MSDELGSELWPNVVDKTQAVHVYIIACFFLNSGKSLFT